jgi:putative transposase
MRLGNYVRGPQGPARLGAQIRESYEDWLGFGRNLVSRGMRSPALIMADGASGIWKAACELWPVAER